MRCAADFVILSLSMDKKEDVMQYAFQLLPHPNVRYQAALEKLGKAELQCMLRALDVFTEPRMESIGGIPFLAFECRELTQKELGWLSYLSGVYLWTRREGEALMALTRPAKCYLPGEMAELLKYKGKTNAAFTSLMLNLARSQSAFAREERPLTVLDPMCGKGTTLYCALAQGMNAVGMDKDRRDLKEAMDFVSRFFQMERIKHSLSQGSRSSPKGPAAPEAVYTLADTREHYQAGDTRTLRFLLGDTRQAGALLRKSPVELLVADLPYGVQHAPEDGGRTESFAQLLRGALPAWREAVRPGGAMALSFNRYTLSKSRLSEWAQEAGWLPLLEAPLDDLEHYVEQAVNRDVLLCRRP